MRERIDLRQNDFQWGRVAERYAERAAERATLTAAVTQMLQERKMTKQEEFMEELRRMVAEHKAKEEKGDSVQRQAK